MWPFKKKKIYKVEYKDTFNDYGCCIVRAIDIVQAWRIAKKQETGPYRAVICINITELKDA